MEYKDLNDYEILYLIEENNDDAIDILYSKYSPVVKKYAYSYYKSLKNKGANLEDLEQEAYLGLISAINNFDSEKEVLFYTYACICIQSKLYNYSRQFSTLKRDAQHHAVSYDQVIDQLDITYLDVLENKKDHPVKLLENAYFNDFIIKFKHSLSFSQSCIFELRANGFSYQEIGDLLSFSKRTVSSSLVRIKQKLKQRLFILKEE